MAPEHCTLQLGDRVNPALNSAVLGNRIAVHLSILAFTCACNIEIIPQAKFRSGFVVDFMDS
jgi:hypothetical protein